MPRRKASQRSWWAERWLNALDGPWEGRLARGRAYAQGGRVQDLHVEPGLATARVQGTRPTPYRVELRMPTLDDAAWPRVAAHLAERAATTAALLNGRLPPEAEIAVAAAGGALFPAADERVAASCSCPDWVRPCKHAAALIHVLAAEMDRDPFLLFALRGRTRDELLGLVRAERVRGAADPPAGAAVQPPTDLARALDGFWTFEAPAEVKPAANGLAAPDASVLRRLGQPPRTLGGSELRRELETAYEVLAERAREALTADRKRARRSRAADAVGE